MASRAAARSAGLALAVLWAAACGRPAPPPLPHVVLVSLDTTRADRIGAYGYEGGTTPHLDGLARESLRFSRAYSTSSWTLPAHASLFTGRLPSSHGARADPAGPISLAAALSDDARWAHYRARGLDDSQTTLAEILGRHGYATAAVVAGPWMKAIFGLDQGFESYDEAGIEGVDGRSAADVTHSALAWLAGRDRSRPLFLFAHYFDPHFPYDPPAEFAPALPAERRGRREFLSRLYDAEIRYMDEEVGGLLAGLRALDLYDDSLVIVTADHGEVLGEHGRFGHGKTLTQVEIRVPLLLKYPAARGGDGATRGETHEPVLLTDVLPTVLTELGIPIPGDVQGEPLPRVRHPIVAEVDPLPVVSDEGAWRVLVEGEFKYIWNSLGRSWLADLSVDPGESEDASADHPEVARRLRRGLLDYFAALPAPPAGGPERRIDAETQRALERLGYLD